MGKQMEGDNVERRRRAKDARERGELPSAEGVTTGASKQRRHLSRQADHGERISAKVAGKQDPDHTSAHTRPGDGPSEPGTGGAVNVSSVNLEGRRVSYRDAGVGDDPVVLIHGFPLEGAMWEYQLEALSDDHRLLAPDLMGFGGSDAPDDPGAYSVEAWADDVGGFVADLGLERAVVVGEGVGAHVAFEVFRRHAELVAALVLADMSTADDTDEDQGRRREEQARLVSGGDVESLADRWLQAVAGDPRSRRAEVVKKARQWIADAPRAGLVGALDAINRRPDITHDLSKIDVPTLVMAGSENPLVPRDALESTVRTVPNAEGVVVPGGGQFSNIESPGAFNRALAQFLDAR